LMLQTLLRLMMMMLLITILFAIGVYCDPAEQDPHKISGEHENADDVDASVSDHCGVA